NFLRRMATIRGRTRRQRSSTAPASPAVHEANRRLTLITHSSVMHPCRSPQFPVRITDWRSGINRHFGLRHPKILRCRSQLSVNVITLNSHNRVVICLEEEEVR